MSAVLLLEVAALMPWLKKAAESPKNDKIWELSDAAYRLYDAAMHYAAEHLTDGHIPVSRIGTLKPKTATPAQISELVTGRLWHRLPDLSCKSCIVLRKDHRAAALPRSGFVVHDFLAYNPSKAEWEEREQRRLGLAQIGGAARAAQAARSGGRFTSGTAGDVTSRETSGNTSGAAGGNGTFHQPDHQPAAGENAPAAPAVEPAVPPAPYSVPRSSSTKYEGAPEADDPEIPDEPRAADRSAILATTRKDLHHIRAPLAMVVANARGGSARG